MVIVTAIDSIKAKRRAEEYVAQLPTADQLTEYLIKDGQGNLVLPDMEFTKPNGEKRIGFYLDATLKANLDDSLIKSVAAKWDGVFMASGMEGCSTEGSRILMADGSWKNVEDIKEGDLVLSPQEDGSYEYGKVTWTTKWFSNSNLTIKELNRHHNTLYTCSSNHLIPMNVKEKDKWIIKRMEAGDYYVQSKHLKKNQTTLSAFPIPKYLGRVNCKIEPYTLGVYLGDGSYTDGCSLSITSSDIEVINEVTKTYQLMNSYKDNRSKAVSYRFSRDSELAKLITTYGLYNKKSGDKFIPQEALLSDLEYRKKLLSGLIDTDGTLSKKGGYSICTKSERMAKNILDLVYSLGGRGKINPITKSIKKLNFTGQYYNVSFYLGEYNLYSKLKRKIKTSSTFYLSPNRVAIEAVPYKPSMVYGFQIDTKSHLYITDNWMITNNSGKTTFISAILKYLDPTFPGKPLNDGTTRRTCDRIVFTPDQFLEAVDNAEPGQAIQCDEAVLEFLAGDAATAVQKLLLKKMVTIRKKRLYICFIIPSIFSFKKEMAVRRTVFLVHTYSPDRIERGSFKFYNYETKRKLFMWGKKDDDQSAAPPDFIGSFTDVEGLFFDVKEYDRKKTKAIESLTMAKEGKNASASLAAYKAKGQRDLLLYYMYKMLENDEIGKEALNNVLTFVNTAKQAGMKVHEKLSPERFADWLRLSFGEHMSFSAPTVRTMMKNAVDFTSKPLDPLFAVKQQMKVQMLEGMKEDQDEETN